MVFYMCSVPEKTGAKDRKSPRDDSNSEDIEPPAKVWKLSPYTDTQKPGTHEYLVMHVGQSFRGLFVLSCVCLHSCHAITCWEA